MIGQASALVAQSIRRFDSDLVIACDNAALGFVLERRDSDLDGAAVFQDMKKLRGDVRVILSSGYDELEVTQRLQGAGLAGFVQKPYLVTTLFEEVRRVRGESGSAP